MKLSLPRNFKCFIPSPLVENPGSSEARFLHVLENLVAAQQITDGFAEQAKQQFPKFLEIAKKNKQSFAEFDPVSSVEKVAEFFKIILTLSHGQTSVERGFSINKSLPVENLTETSLISQRIVLDHLRSKNVSSDYFKVCGKMRKSVRSARGKYHFFLDDQRREKVNN